MDAPAIRRKLNRILSEKGAVRALLFGSAARGTTSRRSDIDLIIIDEQQLHYLDRLDKYHRDIRTALGCPVDLFVYTPAELEAIKDRPFIRRALRESVCVYER